MGREKDLGYPIHFSNADTGMQKIVALYGLYGTGTIREFANELMSDMHKWFTNKVSPTLINEAVDAFVLVQQVQEEDILAFENKPLGKEFGDDILETHRLPETIKVLLRIDQCVIAEATLSMYRPKDPDAHAYRYTCDAARTLGVDSGSGSDGIPPLHEHVGSGFIERIEKAVGDAQGLIEALFDEYNDTRGDITMQEVYLNVREESLQSIAQEANDTLSGTGLYAGVRLTADRYDNSDDVAGNHYGGLCLYDARIYDSDNKPLDGYTTGKYFDLHQVRKELMHFAIDKKQCIEYANSQKQDVSLRRKIGTDMKVAI